MKEALLYERQEEGKVRCGLCPHRCIIADGRRGSCGVRENRGGTLYSLVWGRPISMAVDPIEKKPLFHFLPGSTSLSLATVGCNLTCAHCQNYSISQHLRDRPDSDAGPDGSADTPSGRRDLADIPGDHVEPGEVVAMAVKRRCASISYTYTEPTIYAEYALDIMALAHQKKIANVFVTNGYMTPAFIGMLKGLLDAANVDLKSSSDGFYKNICGGRVGPVKEAIALLHDAGVWVEVTTLVIPGRNDSDGDLRAVAAFLRGISPDIPWHVSRFHPDYRLTDAGATPRETLSRARAVGREAGLKFVYAGNVPGDDGEQTLCPGCGATLIERTGFHVSQNRLKGGTCPECRTKVPGVWENRSGIWSRTSTTTTVRPE